MRGRIVVGVGVAVLVLVAVGLVLTLRDNARPVTLEEARERTTSTMAGTTPADEVPRPRPGIYRYDGGGTESLSTPPLSQSQGPEMPATVTSAADGCWTLRLDYSSNHWQDWTYCPDGEVVSEQGGSTWQRWMIGATAITNLSTFECDPGTTAFALTPEPDTTWQGRCTGTSDAVDGQTVSAGPYRVDGQEVLEVAGEQVDTWRYVSERTMSGAQEGEERSTIWFATDSGLPVRNERSLEVVTDTPIGRSTYTETGWFQLVDTQPVEP